MRPLLLFITTSIIFTQALGQKVETVYLDPNDSSTNLYVVVHPVKQPYAGYLLLVPGMFQTPQEVLIQTELPKYAARQGLLTIIATFKTGIRSFGVDTVTQSSMLAMLDHLTKKYKLKDKKCFMGGFSIGGSCVLRYAELALKNNYAIKPTAVFAVDSPLDFERMHAIMSRELRLRGTPKDGNESTYVIGVMENLFGGSPKTQLATYRKFSPYSYGDTTQAAIKPLVNLPIRLYTEPDIDFWLPRGSDYSSMNAFDFAAMINELNALGNKKATLITTVNKGYRKPDNRRHPHSWSIVDNQDIVKWMLAQ